MTLLPDLTVLVPSRGRPAALADLAEAVHTTAAGAVEVLAAVDDDDPARDEYLQGASPRTYRVLVGPRRSLCGWTNELANLRLAAAVVPCPRYFASLGDDHRPRTPGWDRMLIEAIEQLPGPGFAYGNDLLQGRALPTAWVASTEVVRALGWMMLPTCAHMYVDAAILALGLDTGRIAYRADVIIEHLHPLAGKASWDPSYRESNSSGRYDADRAAYEAWHANQRAADAARLLAVKAGG